MDVANYSMQKGTCHQPAVIGSEEFSAAVDNNPPLHVIDGENVGHIFREQLRLLLNMAAQIILFLTVVLFGTIQQHCTADCRLFLSGFVQACEEVESGERAVLLQGWRGGDFCTPRLAHEQAAAKMHERHCVLIGVASAFCILCQTRLNFTLAVMLHSELL